MDDRLRWRRAHLCGATPAGRGLLFLQDGALEAQLDRLHGRQVGSLEMGKRADFIVLDRDPMQVPPEDLPSTRVLQTWLDGERVFPRD